MANTSDPLARCHLVGRHRHHDSELAFRRSQPVLAGETPEIREDIEHPIMCHASSLPVWLTKP
jgi:hypothetical protein